MRLGPLRGPVLGPQPQHKKEQQPDADAYCPEAPGRELRPIHFPVIGEATLGDGPARVQREQQTNDDKGRQRCQDTIHRSPSYLSQVSLRHVRLVPPALDSVGTPAALRSQLEPCRWLQQHCRQKSLRERAISPCLAEPLHGGSRSRPVWRQAPPIGLRRPRQNCRRLTSRLRLGGGRSMRGRHGPQVTMLALVGSAGFEPATNRL